ncbi:hypothetical protein CC86DRAFT_293691 [Ophiobolus disseminans]|uniref:Uncharacterized protein n=1 Tax=Ophiobolus disseminans TaxID=1469910 RepID=A0A6A6ZXH3_9PLEO|nr:hypothetical protein CC86DRAFT_293691 [Ophiobolus disseminans]
MQPQAIPPNSITLDGLCDRITFLLRRILPTVWTANNLTMLATSLANSIIFLGRSGQLGPDGLSSYSDIFMVIGYEGKGPCRYLGLAVMAPVQLRILMRTGSYDVRGRDPMRDRDCLQHMKDGFHNVAMDQWKTVQESINKSRRLR